MKFNEDITSVLGEKVSYTQDYDPGILVREKRLNNREMYRIDHPLPFVGKDVWNCYEISFLKGDGFPINAVAKIVYDCSSEFIVESKSLKLYLNSFNMYKFNGDRLQAIRGFKKLVSKDLSKLLDTKVSINLFFKEQNKKIFKDFTTIDSVIVEKTFSLFKESPEILQCKEGAQEFKIKSSLLRSNCKITHQPDWGDLFVLYKGDKILDINSFIEYLISFRGENHFHEEVVEMIYKRLFDLLGPEELMVAAIYTRRGGIDINPIRANREELLDINLINVKKHCQKMLRQ